MRKALFALVIAAALGSAGLYFGTKPVVCDDCNKGKKCTTSYDCGEIGVCYCQPTYEEEDGMGTCYFE